MSRYFICEFKYGPYGALVSCYTSDLGSLASPDPSPSSYGDINPEAGKRYLVEVVKNPAFRRLVYVHDDVLDIFRDVQPLLLEATWQRPEHVTGEPWVEVTHEKFGPIKAKLYRPTGGRYVKRSFVEIQFSTKDGQWHSFTLEDGRQVLLGALEQRVRQCVGPAVNLAAAISRQADSRRGQEHWRR